ncbi:protein ANTAGONIST OF LIKE HETEROCHROMATIN PROTEIN 1-like isoform X1 [Portunus trituberculatus]|uniref:protein ANTAGONIST OF LIKE HETEROCHROMATIN PROTEIN 1-like isoform X1 n=1 Tax=Portunus trituberculatus TaxID=210409 RepID=UPI001E1CEB30|nr:protein ANTAGONIST OF LIKE HETEROCHROMATIN PROTEIN 1-like isoform X1 [Portunus trituberculatus]
MKFPSNEEEWKHIAQDFDTMWDFPNCLGAVDGKHVRIVPPANSGSYFYNYKGSDSLVLMAVVNAKYEFIMCDIGVNGRISDGGVIHETVFYEKLCNDDLHIPTPAVPKNSHTALPFVFVGDEAFALRKDFLKPYPQRELTHDRRVFNYRLSRARRVVENVFGILSSRFRIYHSPINMKLEHIDSVVMATCILHNFLRKTTGDTYSVGDGNTADNEPQTLLTGLEKTYSRRATEEAHQVRDMYQEYFNTVGALSWQESRI